MAYSPIVTLDDLNIVYTDILERIAVSKIYNLRGSCTWTNAKNVSASKGDVWNITGVDSGDSFPSDSNIEVGSNIVCIKNKTSAISNNQWGEYFTEVGSYLDFATDNKSGFVSASVQHFSGKKTFLDGIEVLSGNGDNTSSGITIKDNGLLQIEVNTAKLGDLVINGTTTSTHLNVSGNTITSSGNVSVTSISGTSSLSVYDSIKSKNFEAVDSKITSYGDVTVKNINSNTASLSASEEIKCKRLDVTGNVYDESGNLLSNSAGITTGQVFLGNNTDIQIPLTYAVKNSTDSNNIGFNTRLIIGSGDGSDSSSASRNLDVRGHLFATKVHNAVWNDLVDCIEVPESTYLEYGYCYCFDGKEYHKSTKYMDGGIIGIHSDTSGFRMGEKNSNTLDVAISGFVLAHVDKEYKSGTPLTCTKYGILTKMGLISRIIHPERVVATFWKKEDCCLWGPPGSKIQVNERMWVKIK